MWMFSTSSFQEIRNLIHLLQAINLSIHFSVIAIVQQTKDTEWYECTYEQIDRTRTNEEMVGTNEIRGPTSKPCTPLLPTPPWLELIVTTQKQISRQVVQRKRQRSNPADTINSTANRVLPGDRSFPIPQRCLQIQVTKLTFRELFLSTSAQDHIHILVIRVAISS